MGIQMYDVITHKRDKMELSTEEIDYFVSDYVRGMIPDYQVSALLMAIYLNGMTDRETTDLTMAMAHSGDMLNLSEIDGVKLDKHSTGGVGDKTTLIVAPIVAACGGVVAKMSGRSLGHTGGTLDKLESIPGFCTELSRERFVDTVRRVGASVVGQTGNLTPADKLIYALRDVTATVDSIPMIASSIMSKKLAAGSDCILLDVKVGSGAFMKTVEFARELAKKMVAIGNLAGKRTAALITSMDAPLGHAVGNALEVIESVEVLRGNGSADLREISVLLSSHMLALGGHGSIKHCTEMVHTAIESGTALQKLIDMVEAQGGDSDYIKDTSRFGMAAHKMDVVANQSGYIAKFDAEGCGRAAVVLGAGRINKGDNIDPQAGIIIAKKTGEAVSMGETIATLYTNNADVLPDALERMLNSISIGADKPVVGSLLLDTLYGS